VRLESAVPRGRPAFRIDSVKQSTDTCKPFPYPAGASYSIFAASPFLSLCEESPAVPTHGQFLEDKMLMWSISPSIGSALITSTFYSELSLMSGWGDQSATTMWSS
jgi:hypothetical protein